MCQRPGYLSSIQLIFQFATLNSPVLERYFICRRDARQLLLELLVAIKQHTNAVTHKSVYAVVVLLLTLIAGFAAGGTVYPPLFYAAGAYGRHLPAYIKVIGGLCAACGLAIGFYLLFVIYSF